MNQDPEGLLVAVSIQIPPGEEGSIGRNPDVVDAEGRQVAGTFQGTEELGLGPGAMVVLLDAGGAVTASISA